MANCRDILLCEYRENFTKEALKSKLLSGEDGRRFLPLNEKIKMLRSDYPACTIEFELLCDNNIFATVKCRIDCGDGGIAVGIGKWYHTNSDVFGMNYLKTAESNAFSTALRALGYDYTETPEEEPSGNQNVGPVIELPFILDDNQEFILNPKAGKAGIIEGKAKSPKKENGLTFEQARCTIMQYPPINGMSIGDILDRGEADQINKLREVLSLHKKSKLSLAAVADVILPYLNEKG